MDLKDHLFAMKERLRADKENYWTLHDVADHFDVAHSFVAGWFSRTPRVPSYNRLMELAKISGYSDEEINKLHDAWFHWGFSRGSAGHLAEPFFDNLAELSPRVRRKFLDAMTAAEIEAAKKRKPWGG